MKNKNKVPTIKTKRLLLTETDPSGRWRIKTSDGNTDVGEVTVTVPEFIKKTAEIKYEICPECKDEGYAAEALAAVSEHVFGKGEIYFVRVTVTREEESKGEMLKACGFLPINADEETEIIVYEKEKAKSSYMSIYMMLGMSSGMCLGLASDKMAVGMCIGMAAGMALGIALDRMDENARKR